MTRKKSRSKQKKVLRKKTQRSVSGPSIRAQLTPDRLQAEVDKNPGDIKARLALADYFVRHESEANIPQLLEPVEKDYPFDDGESRRRYDRLLALGFAHAGRLVEAEKICQRGLKDEPGGPDYLFVLTFVHLSLREFDKAVACGQEFLEGLESRRSDAESSPHYCVTSSHLSQLHNMLGSAYFEKSEWDMSMAHFEQSIYADPGNHLPYINLANVAKHHKDIDGARRIIQQGLKCCRQVQELRMLGNTLEASATVSACMIVKNEEKLLPGCLESIRDWVDEIIIVDTGSTDSTVEIAESYGAKIFHQEWEGNFSKHRNYSLEQATCEWVFIIDADERFVVEDLPQLRRLINDDEYDILSINVFNVYGPNEELTTFLPSVRLWRRKIGLRYEGIVHNLLKLGQEHPVLRADVRLKHLGYGLDGEKMGQKFHRTKELLEKQLEEDPNNFFALFNYAQLLKGENQTYAVKNIPVIIESASKAVELTDPEKKDERPIHLMCLDHLAWANYFRKSYDEALKYCERALGIKSNYLDPLLLKGHIYGQRQQWDEAFDAYQKYLEVQRAYKPSKEADCLILTHIDSRANANYGLGLISEARGDKALAREYYLRTVENQPGHLEVNLRLANLYLDEGDFSSAVTYFRKQLDLTVSSAEAAIGLAAAYQKSGDGKQAEACLLTAIEANPSHVGLCSRYAELLLEQGREDEAVEQFQKVAESDGGGSSAIVKLAELYGRAGRYEEAVETYQKVVDLGEVSAELLNDIGNCHFKMKQYESAEEYYLKALERDGTLAVAFRNLGLAQTGLEKYDAALESLEKYSELAAEDADILPIMGDICAKAGQFESALGHYERYLAQNPSSVSVLYRLSECYLNMGHRDSAVLGYRRVLQLDREFEPAQKRLDEILQAVTPTG